MKSAALVLSALLFWAPVGAQEDISSNRARKERVKAEKQKAAEREWERQTEPPYPAHFASVRPEFQTALRQAAGLIDNAFNTITSSRFEFSIANQNAQQAMAMVKGSATNEGETQAAETLAAYAEIVPVCQQAAWDATSNVILLAIGNYGRCQREARRRRAVAEKTLLRNSQPAPALSIVVPSDEVLPASENTFVFPPSKSGVLAVRLVSTRRQEIILTADSAGRKSEIYDAGTGASFVISDSLVISSPDLDSVQVFVGETRLALSGKSARILIKK